MNFRPMLAAKVMVGEKTVTRRLTSSNPNSPWWHGKCGLEPGRDYAVCPGRGRAAVGRVIVTSVRRERLGHLHDSEARREGFGCAAEFERAFEAINGSYDPLAMVWRVELEVVA